jgi:5-oxoprolinase (ATP-hydrolysing)
VPAERGQAIGTKVDPVMLEIFNNLFMSIAEQMGSTLEKTSHSVNIKERLDFSCAVFDRDGQLIANAPHMPVHLGSMGESVQTIIRERAGTMAPGDVFVLNAPYNGGTHIPDVTVITPVFAEGAKEILFWVASRVPRRHRGSAGPCRRTARYRRECVDISNVDGGPSRDRAARAWRRRYRPQPRSEHRRSAGTDRRQREGAQGYRMVITSASTSATAACPDNAEVQVPAPGRFA